MRDTDLRLARASYRALIGEAREMLADALPEAAGFLVERASLVLARRFRERAALRAAVALGECAARDAAEHVVTVAGEAGWPLVMSWATLVKVGGLDGFQSRVLAGDIAREGRGTFRPAGAADDVVVRAVRAEGGPAVGPGRILLA